ncbi:cysteine--tRNA ligase [Patescibacteria group bacterium]|nr:cysteine--tRNA ligase [Patescibacteria group bacterium]
MKLYNTMSRSIEEFNPIAPPAVGLYACGLTVYDYTHLGHLRKYTMDDVLIRTLRHAGYKVQFVQNVTDVGHLSSDADTGEDKLEKGAKKYGKSVWDIAREFEAYFFRSMDLMGNARPDVSCRATEHIQQQLDMVIELEKKGFAYVIEGDGVYFDTSKVDDYGKLAHLDLEHLQEGARVERVEGKRNPTDFALWKFERPGENRAMVWESPWAKRSFPGWHIECSAMAIHYLGDQFDIHTGGIDHIPVHHTNEIAQAEAATGQKPFVRYWVHHNFLRVDGEKMSKSLGNFYTIDDILKRGINPKALRLLFLTTHYRSEMNFTWEALEGSQKAWQKLAKMVLQFRAEEGRTVLSQEKLDKIDEYRKRFFGFMEDDLKTPEALTVLYEVVKSNIPSSDKYDLLGEFDEVLGLGFRQLQETATEMPIITDLSTVPAEAQQLLAQRKTAREQKDWASSDKFRDELVKLGYEVIDGPTGQQLRQIHPVSETGQ